MEQNKNKIARIGVESWLHAYPERNGDTTFKWYYFVWAEIRDQTRYLYQKTFFSLEEAQKCAIMNHEIEIHETATMWAKTNLQLKHNH